MAHDKDMKFLLVVLTIISLLTLLIILPVLEYVLLSIILAYILFPLHVRFRKYVGSMVSAISLILAALVAIIVPIGYVLYVFVQDLVAIAEGDTSIEVDVIEARVEEVTGTEVNLVELSTDVAESFVDILFGGVTGILSTAMQFFIGVALVLFLVFYILREGEAFVSWLRELSPLPQNETDHLFRKVNQTMWGSVIGHTFAAIVQAIVAGLGLYIAGISSVAFWTVVMAILAFLPIIGAFLIWAPASVYLVFVTGDTVAGVFLFVYGLAIVSLIDYYVRPLVIDREARLNPGVILIGVFGGIFTFGFVGLFVGPIVIGVLAATLQTINEKQTGKPGPTQQTIAPDEASIEAANTAETQPEGGDA